MIGMTLGQLIASQRPYKRTGRTRRRIVQSDFTNESPLTEQVRKRPPWGNVKVLGVYPSVFEAIHSLPRRSSQVGIRLKLEDDSGAVQRFAHTYAKRQDRAISTRTRDGIVWIRERRAEGVGK